MSKIALAFLLCFAPAIIPAQTVYQCIGPGGSVTYSQSPCGKDAKLIMGSSTPAKRTASDGDNAQPIGSKAADKSRPDPNIQAISDSVDDANCRRAAEHLFVAPSTAKIDQAESEIRERQNRSWVGRNAAQVQNMARMDEQEILMLRQAISA